MTNLTELQREELHKLTQAFGVSFQEISSEFVKLGFSAKENRKEKLMQLLELCIEKNLNFQLYEKACLLEVSKFDEKNERIFYIRCYYDVDREVISVGALTSFSNLINEVKNYQP